MGEQAADALALNVTRVLRADVLRLRDFQSLSCVSRALRQRCCDARAALLPAECALSSMPYHRPREAPQGGFEFAEGTPEEDQFAVVSAAAAEGDARAINAVGVVLNSGKGGAPRDDAVWRWLLAACQGHLGALCAVGNCFQKGRSVRYDNDVARRCFELAANLGSGHAWFRLGLAHESRYMGFAQDRAEAVRCYEHSANLGYARGLFHLGLFKLGLYLHRLDTGWQGNGELHFLAAALSPAPITYQVITELARGYRTDHEVRDDFALAREWFVSRVETSNKDVVNNVLGMIHALLRAADL